MGFKKLGGFGLRVLGFRVLRFRVLGLRISGLWLAVCIEIAEVVGCELVVADDIFPRAGCSGVTAI